MPNRSAVSRTTRVVVPALACLAVTAMASPASAGRPDSSTSVRSGERASVSWTELDPADTLRLPGNTHVGDLQVEDGSFGSFAFGQILDYQCDPGEVTGGHDGPGTCDLLQVRFLDGTGDLVVSGTTARYTGTITVSNGGHGDPTDPTVPGGPGTVLAQVPASITWTSSADLVRFRETFSVVDGGVRFSSRVRGLRSDVATTTVTGALGRMGFADDRDDVAQGEFRSFTEVSRDRIRT